MVPNQDIITPKSTYLNDKESTHNGTYYKSKIEFKFFIFSRYVQMILEL